MRHRDADYLCLDGGFTRSLHDEIVDDSDRPVVAYSALSADGASLQLRGFALADAGTALTATLTCPDGQSVAAAATAVDASWGARHGRSWLLQSATLALPAAARPLCAGARPVAVVARSAAGKEAFHAHYLL